MSRARITKFNDVPKLLTITDLSIRWDMSRQSLHDKKGGGKFPLPIQYVANNRTALFLESDIIQYENDNPYIKNRTRGEATKENNLSYIVSK